MLHAALDAGEETPRLGLPPLGVVELHIAGLEPPHRLLGQRRADLLGQALRGDRHAAAQAGNDDGGHHHDPGEAQALVRR